MTIPHVKAVAAAVCVASLPSLGHAAEQDTVVVTATGFEQKIQDAPASISVITKQQIEDKAYRDVTDALKDVPASSSPAGVAAAISVFVVWLRNTRSSGQR